MSTAFIGLLLCLYGTVNCFRRADKIHYRSDHVVVGVYAILLGLFLIGVGYNVVQ